MPQSTYLQTFPTGFAGMPGETGDYLSRAYLNKEATAIPAGIGVVEGAAVGQCLLPAAAADKIAGIVVNSYARNPGDSGSSLTGTQAIMPDAVANVMQSGAIWVVVEEAVAITDDVYMRHATGTGTQLGAFRNDGDTNTCRQVKGARFLSATTGAGVALLWIDVAVDRAFV